MNTRKMNIVWFPLCELPRKDVFMQTESTMVVKVGQGRRMGWYCLVGIEFQFYKMQGVLEMDVDDSYTTV